MIKLGRNRGVERFSLLEQIKGSHAFHAFRMNSSKLKLLMNFILNLTSTTSTPPASPYFKFSYTARASSSFFITPCFSSAEFQSGYWFVISIVRSIHALK